MRYYRASQRHLGGRWDYTVQHGTPTKARPALIEPVGYCIGSFDQVWPNLSLEEFNASGYVGFCDYEQYQKFREERLPVSAKYHSDGHDTADGACECYREYLLDNNVALNIEGEANTLHKCEAMDCDEWTKKMVLYDGYFHFWLCDQHRTRDVVATLAPEVGERWSS